MKTRHWIIISIAIVIAGVSIYFVTRPRPPITFTIWHTESDPKANQRLALVKAQFEQQLQARGANRRPVIVTVQYVPWGQLAMRLTAVLGSTQQPDLTHLEPYMTAALVRREMLVPMNEVIVRLQEKHQILPSVLKLQKFGADYFGLAYAVGSTFLSYRRDWVREVGLDFDHKPPQTWDALVALLPELREIALKHNARVVMLPGGDPFFLDQFFGEILASYEGSLFRGQAEDFVPAFVGDPNPEHDSVFQALNVLHRLSGPPGDKSYLARNWDTIAYLEQFTQFARGAALMVPVTYGRATQVLDREFHPMDGSRASQDVFGVIPQPGPTPGSGRATIDCENWSILRRQKASANEQLERQEMARQFLELYYDTDNYLQYAAEVPVHLTPIFEDLSRRPDGAYWQQPPVRDWLKKWSSWADRSQAVLSAENRVNPILMSRWEDNLNPYLLECQRARLITDMVTVALKPESTAADIRHAQEASQDKAVQVVSSFKQNAGR